MIGSVLCNRYEIQSVIGEGGMAIVYCARDLLLQRQVAIKILHAHMSRDAELCARFQQEASIAAKLDHPNIVKIYDFGTHSDGRAFIVSELVKGMNFHHLQVQRLRETGRPLEPIVCAMICNEVAKGLQHAHASQFVHRDVKPDNVMIAQDGQVKLTDFGIAKNLSRGITVVGHFLGSPSYSSAEQIQGKAVNFSSDIFSLGVIIYESLTGKLPFSGLSATEVMLKICQGDWTPLPNLKSKYPEILSEVVTKCLRQNPKDRFKSTSDLVVKLDEYLVGNQITESSKGLQEYFTDPVEFLRRYNVTTVKIPDTDVSQQSEIADAVHPKIAIIPATPKVNRQIRATRIERVPLALSSDTSFRPGKQQPASKPWGLGILFVLAIAIGLGYVYTANAPKIVPIKSTESGVTLSPVVPAPIPLITEKKDFKNEERGLQPQKAVVRNETKVKEPVVPKPPPVLRIVKKELTKTTTRASKAGVPSTPIPEMSKILGVKTDRTRDRAESAETPRTEQSRIVLSTIPPNVPVFINDILATEVAVSKGGRVFDVRPGASVVRLKKTESSGVKYNDLTRNFYVPKGKTLNPIVLKMTALRTLSVNISGPQVVARVNGDPYPLDTKPLVLTLPEGKVNIEARASNGRALRRVIDLRGDNFSLNASLE